MKALVVAGARSQAALIDYLKEQGCEVIIADWNENAPAVSHADKYFPVSTLDVDGIRELAKSEKVDFITTVCADQVLLVVAQVSEELGLPCYIDYATAKNVSNKEYMKRIFTENGVPTSKHIVASEFDSSLTDGMTYPLIVKPVDSYSSRGVKRVENNQELVAAFDNAVNISRTGTAIIEEYVGGFELSVDVYVEDGVAKVLSCGVLDKIPGVDGFIICRGNYSPEFFSSVEDKVKDTAQKIADAFKLKNTPMLIQMKIDGNRVGVIEFCARSGGGIKYWLIPKLSGFDTVKAVADLTMGKKPHAANTKYNKYLINEFIYCSEGELDRCEGFRELMDEGVIVYYEIYKPKGYKFNKISCSADRCAFFSVEADTLEELEVKHKIAADRVKAISVDGKDLIRHDIIHSANYLK